MTASTIALIEAQRAREVACHSVIQVYNPKTATVADMQTYASCVQTVYPSSIEVPQWAAKSSIVVIIAAMVWGCLKGWKEDGPLGVLMIGMLIAPLAAAFGLFVLFCLFAGVEYLFT